MANRGCIGLVSAACFRPLGTEWELADTLNSLGALSQKQQKYDAAAGLYVRSLELRRGRAVPAGDDEQAKAKQQGMAQSFVSLGNLEIERGDAAVAEAASDDRLPPGAARQAGATFYLAARMHMEAARDAYVHGFSSSHPKVAWALEGLAKIHEKCGDLGAALETYRQASELRRKLQESDQSKNLFHKELTYVEERRLELSDRKAKAAKLLGAALGGARHRASSPRRKPRRGTRGPQENDAERDRALATEVGLVPEPMTCRLV